MPHDVGVCTLSVHEHVGRIASSSCLSASMVGSSFSSHVHFHGAFISPHPHIYISPLFLSLLSSFLSPLTHRLASLVLVVFVAVLALLVASSQGLCTGFGLGGCAAVLETDERAVVGKSLTYTNHNN